MHLDVTQDQPDTTLICVTGELDLATAPELRETLRAATTASPGQVTVDLRDVSFLDAAGLDVLIDTHQRLEDAGGHLQIRCTNERVLRVIRLMRLDAVLTITA